jgi:hypothetical protein
MYKDWNDPDQVQAKEQILGGELMPVSLVLQCLLKCRVS